MNDKLSKIIVKFEEFLLEKNPTKFLIVLDERTY